MGEKVFLKEQQVVYLGMRELGIKMAGLGLHDREAWFPNQMSLANIHNGSTMITWAKGEGAEGYGSCLKLGRHPHAINERFACPVALLEGDW